MIDHSNVVFIIVRKHAILKMWSRMYVHLIQVLSNHVLVEQQPSILYSKALLVQAALILFLHVMRFATRNYRVDTAVNNHVMLALVHLVNKSLMYHVVVDPLHSLLLVPMYVKQLVESLLYVTRFVVLPSIVVDINVEPFVAQQPNKRVAKRHPYATMYMNALKFVDECYPVAIIHVKLDVTRENVSHVLVSLDYKVMK